MTGLTDLISRVYMRLTAWIVRSDRRARVYFIVLVLLAVALAIYLGLLVWRYGLPNSEPSY